MPLRAECQSPEMIPRLLTLSLLFLLASCSNEESVSSRAGSTQTPLQELPPLPPLEPIAGSEAPTPPPQPPPYAAGDSLQGMWNYDRRNANIRMNIISLDAEKHTIVVTLQSEDLDNGEKEFRGTFDSDGSLKLEGIKDTGSDYDRDSSYHVRNLLDRDSSMKIELEAYGSKIKGPAEDGTNLYFFTRL